MSIAEPSAAPLAATPAIPHSRRRGGADHSEKPHVQGALVFAVVVCHLGALAAPWTFSWSGVAILLALWWITGGLGICLGYHRQFTHQSYKTYPWVRHVLITLGCLANEGAPIPWVGTHRLHHKHADHVDDPHSPNTGGFAWGHMIWAFFYEHAGARRAARDLARDPFISFIDRWCLVPTFVLAGVLFLLGGWSWVVWGVCVRTVFVLHCTWFVNSAAHTWGYRSFETTDDSKNNWWVALLTFGEGWHNNHHAYHRSAAHGLRWYEVDLTYYTIKLMETLGLAWDLKTPPAEALAKVGSPITPAAA